VSVEKVKLTLLAHSQNMLNAAREKDWERFSQLDSAWQPQLESAVAEYGSELNSIGPQLMKDNQNIQNCIQRTQHELAVDLEKNMHANSAVKKYLK
jgi:hypothetical protein